jgi:hypothetical protein
MNIFRPTIHPTQWNTHPTVDIEAEINTQRTFFRVTIFLVDVIISNLISSNEQYWTQRENHPIPAGNHTNFAEKG